MKYIKTFEANIENTYLEPKYHTNINTSGEFQKISKAKQIYGKIFKEAPTTKDKSWGIEFKLTMDDKSNEEWASKVYKVVFTNSFFKNFIKKNADNSWWKKFLSIFSIGDMSFKSLKTEIVCEPNNTNRIHFSQGISEDFRGIGLGYVIYESFIKFLGYASSATNASQLAQKVWSQIAKDPDFYCIISKTGRSGNDTGVTNLSGSIMAIHKDCKEDITDKICNWMIKQKREIPNEWENTEGKWSKVGFEGFSIDDELLSKYPNIEKTFSEMQRRAYFQAMEEEER